MYCCWWGSVLPLELFLLSMAHASLPTFLSFPSLHTFFSPYFPRNIFIHFTPYNTIIITLATYLHNINRFLVLTLWFLGEKNSINFKFGQKVNKIGLKIVTIFFLKLFFNKSSCMDHFWLHSKDHNHNENEINTSLICKFR